MRLRLATGNPHKVEEIAEIFGPTFEIEAVDPGVEETGTTFEENALLKARAIAGPGMVAIADDSGIEVDALDGGPGIRSARWVDEGRWIDAVLEAVAARPEAGFGCRYVCAAAMVKDGEEHVVRGVVEGRVAPMPRGTGGFGYDPIVIPVEGDGRTFAELSADEKHALSHRGRAFRALRDLL